MKDPPDERTPSEKLALRNSWLKIFVVVTATTVVGVKLWLADFSAAFAAFEFSDLLALFLALFAIALSVLFYLKATETSNVFYNNTYLFTKEVSEILGRVEAGFGERLRHLDEGYSGLKTAVENIPFDSKQAEKEIAEEERQVHKVEKERVALIENLAKRAQLQEKEKESLFKRLEEQDEELSTARHELHILRARQALAESSDADALGEVPTRIRHRLRHLLSRHGLTTFPAHLPSTWNRRLRSLLQEESGAFRRDLQRYGLIDRHQDLTPSGLALIRKLNEATND